VKLKFFDKAQRLGRHWEAGSWQHQETAPSSAGDGGFLPRRPRIGFSEGWNAELQVWRSRLKSLTLLVSGSRFWVSWAGTGSSGTRLEKLKPLD
jgi:hypothetical protein